VVSNLLGKILASKREEAKWGWRKLCNEEFHYLYSCTNIRAARMMRLARHEREGKFIEYSVREVSRK
jgi:hypothetical protein